MVRFHQPETWIAFVLGKPVRSTTIFPEVFDRLRVTHARITVHVPSVGDPWPDDARPPDLIVQRGLSPDLLARAQQLELDGTRFCNQVSATVAVADRALTAQTLANHGLPVPRTVQAETWTGVRELTQGRPVVVKAADGTAGRGSGVLISDGGALPDEPPFDGPFIFQDFVAGDGVTYKVYVAGPEARGLIKQSPLGGLTGTHGVPFEVDSTLADLAQRTRSALDLELFGMDIMLGPTGPVIVDVNPFPGFRGVPQAAWMVAEHLTTMVHAKTHTR